MTSLFEVSQTDGAECKMYELHQTPSWVSLVHPKILTASVLVAEVRETPHLELEKK